MHLPGFSANMAKQSFTSESLVQSLVQVKMYWSGSVAACHRSRLPHYLTPSVFPQAMQKRIPDGEILADGA